jgi:hypothetical protein
MPIIICLISERNEALGEVSLVLSSFSKWLTYKSDWGKQIAEENQENCYEAHIGPQRLYRQEWDMFLISWSGKFRKKPVITWPWDDALCSILEVEVTGLVAVHNLPSPHAVSEDKVSTLGCQCAGLWHTQTLIKQLTAPLSPLFALQSAVLSFLQS